MIDLPGASFAAGHARRIFSRILRLCKILFFRLTYLDYLGIIYLDNLSIGGITMAKQDKGTLPGSTTMLVLALLKEREMYGYQIIEELERRSESVFQLKEGTLYPILHSLEKDRLLTAREQAAPNGRTRRYYRITPAGLRALEEKRQEWTVYAKAVTAILAGA